MERHAVVIGASIAGLATARVLSDHFARVTVVERDRLPDGMEDRAGVPQARHVHALLARGRRDLERLLPGFESLVRARGGNELDFGWDFAVLRQTAWQPRQRSPLPLFFASRTLIESVVRDLVVQQRRNVTFLERTAVTALLAGDGEPRRVVGVRLTARDGGGMTDLAADLVVDASGRTSHGPAWLGALGLPAPDETVVDSFSSYATRWYRAPEQVPASWWWKGIWLDPLLDDPAQARAGVLFPVEGGRWIITVASIAGTPAPQDDAEFMATLRGLRSPILADAAALAEPLSPVFQNREMENRFRHYERWPARLDGFVALGDAACKFNPVYGQGMTSAVACAGILDDCLRELGPANAALPRTFFARQAAFLREPWGMAIGADFRFPSTVGERPPLMGLMQTYFDVLFDASLYDVTVRDTIIDAINMLQPSTTLFGPTMLARAALHALRRVVAGGGTVPSQVPAAA